MSLEPDWLRDLRWLLLSPPLLSTVPGAHPAPVQQFTATEVTLIEAWLRGQAGFAQPPYRQNTAAADTASPLVTLDPPRRLGRHAEQLLSYFLQAGPTHRGHAAHLALRQTPPEGGTTTVGEIDFLVEDRHGQRWHWELAVKFYLCAPLGLRGQDEGEVLQAAWGQPERRPVMLARHADDSPTAPELERLWVMPPGW